MMFRRKSMKKKVLLILVATLMLTIMLGTFVACASGNSNTGSSNVPTPTPITPDDDGGQDDPDITPPGTDDPVDPPITDDPVDPPIDDPVDPPVIEKTEAEYKAECIDVLEEIALTALNNSNELWTFSNVELKAVNASTGTIYCYADGKFFSSTRTDFYIIKTNQSITDASFEEALETLEGIDANSITEIEAHSILEGQVSEESYNNLVEYVLAQVNLEGANVFNVTGFESVDGRNESNLTVELNGIIYNINVNLASFGSQEDHIENLLDENRTERITVTSEENFLSFETIGDPVDPPVVEKTEAEYKAECMDLIEEIALTALNNSNKFWTYSNVELKAVNASTGTIYCYADGKISSLTRTDFFIIKTNQSITDASFEEALETLEGFDANSITEVEPQSILEGQVSEEMYNKLVDYVLEQVNLEGANVLNATEFALIGDGSGKIKANLIVELNNIIYDVQIKGYSAESLDEEIAKELLSKSSTTYSVISEENFLSFESIGDAQE